MKNKYSLSKFKSIDWIFKLKTNNQGKLVQKYNIILARIDTYLISTSQLKGFELARSKQDLSAFEKYGKHIAA